jgi:vacuolar iron transporter family protein
MATNPSVELGTQHPGARSAKPHQYSFGATSAIITNLALITGLDAAINARIEIIAGLLVIALADNLSDALGIHIHQETEFARASEVWFSTFTNFSARLLISAVFILFVAIMPLQTAVICSVIYGFAVLTVISILVAREKGRNVYLLVFEHVAIAVSIVIASHKLGRWIIGKF